MHLLIASEKSVARCDMRIEFSDLIEAENFVKEGGQKWQIHFIMKY